MSLYVVLPCVPTRACACGPRHTRRVAEIREARMRWPRRGCEQEARFHLSWRLISPGEDALIPVTHSLAGFKGAGGGRCLGLQVSERFAHSALIINSFSKSVFSTRVLNLFCAEGPSPEQRCKRGENSRAQQSQGGPHRCAGTGQGQGL